MKITASLIPSTNIPWQPGTEFHTWFKGFEFNTQSARFAQATNEKCEVICYVRFVRSGDVFLITDFSFTAGVTQEDARRSGDAIDLCLEKQAQLEGVTKLLLIKPGTHECEEVRTYFHCQNVSRLPEVKNPSPAIFFN